MSLETRVTVVMHFRELRKSTATAPLALEALSNSEKYVYGIRDAPLDMHHVPEPGRRVLLLFPFEDARPLTPALLDERPEPVTLVVPDGSWRQARKMAKRLPGLERAERVSLPPGPPTAWGIRKEPNVVGVATFEAIARALGIIESREVQQQLELLFGRLVRGTFATRANSSPRSRVSHAVESGGALEVLYRDEHLIAINKPAGLLTHRGWANDGVTALQRLRDQVGRFLYPIHRLDRATSGGLLFAFTSEVARDMQQAFASGTVNKRYLALCRGNDPGLLHVDYPLSRGKGSAARPAATDFRLLGTFERYGLYEASPRTGRTHQIRRHLKHMSHPIIGDVRYGKGEHNRIFRERFGFHRLALHCQRLSFDHPRRDQRVDVFGALPPDFEELLAALSLDRARRC